MYTARKERALQKVANETMRYRPDCRGVKARFFYSWITAVAGASARSVRAHALAQHRAAGRSHVELASSTLQRPAWPGLRDSGVSTMRRPRPTTACWRWRRRCCCARSAATSSRYIRLVSWMSRRSSVDLGIGHPLLRCVRGPDSWRARSKAWRVLGRASAQAGRRPGCRYGLSIIFKRPGPSVMDFLCSIHTYVNFVKRLILIYNAAYVPRRMPSAGPPFFQPPGYAMGLSSDECQQLQREHCLARGLRTRAIALQPAAERAGRTHRAAGKRNSATARPPDPPGDCCPGSARIELHWSAPCQDCRGAPPGAPRRPADGAGAGADARAPGLAGQAGRAGPVNGGAALRGAGRRRRAAREVRAVRERGCDGPDADAQGGRNGRRPLPRP